MSGTDAPVAAIVPVGIDAVVGDVVVAAVVTTRDLDDALTIDAAESHDPSRRSGELLLHVNHATYGKLITLRMMADPLTSKFVYMHDDSSVITPDKLLGDRFKVFAELADFVMVVGFCPQTESDALERTRKIIGNLDRVVAAKYEDADVYKVFPEVADGNFDAMWGTATHEFPRTRLPVTEEAAQSISNEAIRQILFTTLAAEAVATGVRAVRTIDLDDVHPSLRLTSNWGYGTRGMLSALQVSTRLSEKGLRGQLTERWTRWAEAEYSMSGRGAPVPVTLGTEVVRRIGKFEVVMDSKNREAIAFDRVEAERMAKELEENPVAIRDQWAENYASDVATKLESGMTLNGRQMFKLVEIHDRHMK